MPTGLTEGGELLYIETEEMGRAREGLIDSWKCVWKLKRQSGCNWGAQYLNVFHVELKKSITLQ